MLSNVLALVVVLVGLVAVIQLPSSQYPNVVPPTVQVTTRYPGASARTLVNSVALPIEQNVNGVENMIYMQSTSADDGTYTLAVTFAIGTNPDMAQVLVQNRVAIALSSLPAEVQVQGVTTKKQSTSILEFVGLVSPDSRFDSLFLSNYAVINVQDELRRLDGVGDVTVLGAGQYAMRVWLEPGPAAGAGAGAAGRHQHHSAAEPGSHRRPGRRAARPERPGFSIYAEPQRPAGRPGASSRTSSSRSIPPTAGRSPGSATSAASSSAPRPTASRSTSTAVRPRESPFPCCRRPTPSRSPTR